MPTTYQLTLTKTLWQDVYRARVDDNQGHYVGTLRITLFVPLPPEVKPADAPDVPPLLEVFVENATIDDTADLVPFEETLSRQLLERFAAAGFTAAQCIFAYPSPAALWKQN